MTFTIKPQTISGTLNVSTKKTYTGKEITLSSGEYTLTKIGKTYVEGQDFELSYEDNTNAGTATVYANGIGNYTGSVKATFTIQKLSLTDSHVVVEPEKIADQIYTGNRSNRILPYIIRMMMDEAVKFQTQTIPCLTVIIRTLVRQPSPSQVRRT